MCVKSTSPDTKNHDKNGYVKLNDDKNFIMTNVDNSDTTYTNKHKNTGKKQYENIHDRFIRDMTFRKTMIELGRSEDVILEMDRLASEDHSHIATEEEIDVYRGNWWPLKFGEFRHDADKAST